jgi:hypothetical protein
MAKKEPGGSKILQNFMNDVHSVAHNPRFQTIVAHGVLELLINTLIEHHCKHGKKITERTRDYPHSVKLVILHEKGVVDDLDYKVIDAFRHLRNKAVHETPFEVTKKLLAPFTGVLSMGDLLPLDDPNHYTHLCGSLVFGLWNKHPTFFHKHFEQGELPKH